MKSILVSLSVVLAFVLPASAQTKAVQVAKISTPGIQCEMCKNRIEQYLKRIDGVTYVNVAVKKKEANIKFLTDRTNIEMIKTAIANAGYDVAKPAVEMSQPVEIEIAANPDSYKLLPRCCKKPDDGSNKLKQ